MVTEDISLNILNIIYEYFRRNNKKFAAQLQKEYQINDDNLKIGQTLENIIQDYLRRNPLKRLIENSEESKGSQAKKLKLNKNVTEEKTSLPDSKKSKKQLSKKSSSESSSDSSVEKVAAKKIKLSGDIISDKTTISLPPKKVEQEIIKPKTEESSSEDSSTDDDNKPTPANKAIHINSSIPIANVNNEILIKKKTESSDSSSSSEEEINKTSVNNNTSLKTKKINKVSELKKSSSPDSSSEDDEETKKPAKKKKILNKTINKTISTNIEKNKEHIKSTPKEPSSSLNKLKKTAELSKESKTLSVNSPATKVPISSTDSSSEEETRPGLGLKLATTVMTVPTKLNEKLAANMTPVHPSNKDAQANKDILDTVSTKKKKNKLIKNGKIKSTTDKQPVDSESDSESDNKPKNAVVAQKNAKKSSTSDSSDDEKIVNPLVKTEKLPNAKNDEKSVTKNLAPVIATKSSSESSDSSDSEIDKVKSADLKNKLSNNVSTLSKPETIKIETVENKTMMQKIGSSSSDSSDSEEDSTTTQGGKNADLIKKMSTNQTLSSTPITSSINKKNLAKNTDVKEENKSIKKTTKLASKAKLSLVIPSQIKDVESSTDSSSSEEEVTTLKKDVKGKGKKGAGIGKIPCGLTPKEKTPINDKSKNVINKKCKKTKLEISEPTKNAIDTIDSSSSKDLKAESSCKEAIEPVVLNKLNSKLNKSSKENIVSSKKDSSSSESSSEEENAPKSKSITKKKKVPTATLR